MATCVPFAERFHKPWFQTMELDELTSKKRGCALNIIKNSSYNIDHKIFSEMQQLVQDVKESDKIQHVNLEEEI